MSVEVIQLKNQPVNSNCYILYNKGGNNKCIIIDPGTKNAVLLQDCLKVRGVEPEYIILTHEHFDHIWGCNVLLKQYPVKIICSALCSEFIQQPKKNLSAFYNQQSFSLAPADICVEDLGCTWVWQKEKICFFLTPGHTDTGICFTIQHYLFTGDTLIKNVKTVTKLFSGSREKLEKSISLIERLKGYHFLVCPGHGEMFGLDNYDLNKALI